MIPKKVKAPETVDKYYFTPGQEYTIHHQFVNSFEIFDDDGDLTYCLFKGCTFAGGQDWIVTEWEELNN